MPDSQYGSRTRKFHAWTVSCTQNRMVQASILSRSKQRAVLARKINSAT